MSTSRQEPTVLPPRSLRLAEEPFAYVGELQVHDALVRDPRAYIEHLETSLTRIAERRWQLELPAKQIFSDGPTAGDFRVMPCVVRSHSVLKTIKIVGTNRRQETVPDQITVGKLVVLDEVENFVTHVFEACLLSSARTGACAAVAIRRLQSPRRRVVVVGAGRVGVYAALYASALEGVEQVLLCDRLRARAEQAVADLRAMRPGVRFSATVYREILETDVLVLATDAAAPVYRRRDFPAGLVVSLGADADSQSELDVEMATGARIYVDHPDSALSGDLKLWLAGGHVRRDAIASFFDVMLSGAPPCGEPKVFISTGSALFDNMTVAYYLRGR